MHTGRSVTAATAVARARTGTRPAAAASASVSLWRASASSAYERASSCSCAASRRQLHTTAAASSLFTASWARGQRATPSPPPGATITPGTPGLSYSGYTDLHRADLERALERAVQTGTGGPLIVTALDHHGQFVPANSGELGRAEICSRYGVQPRDLRKLDSKVSTTVPAILVRKAAIILNMAHLRVLITANEVLLFDPQSHDAPWEKSLFLYHLQHAVRGASKYSNAAASGAGASSATNNGCSSGTGGLPFEFRALESCLTSVVSALEREVSNLRNITVQLLDGLEHDIRRERLIPLLQYSRKLSAFKKRVLLVQQCIDELLSNDDDLAAAYLSATLAGSPRDAQDHEELELLLESFSTQVEEIHSEADNLSAYVKHSEQVIELILDANRNSLLGLDLRVSIATFALTGGAMGASIFGMNLATGLEDSTLAFVGVSSTLALVSLAVGAAVWRRMLKISRVGLASDMRDSALVPARSRLSPRRKMNK